MMRAVDLTNGLLPQLQLMLLVGVLLTASCVSKAHRSLSSSTSISSGKIAYCEAEILRYGSNLADEFNAPIGKQNWNQRTHQNGIVRNIGFAPWVANGVHGTKGLTLSGKDAKQLHAELGWIQKNISDSPYQILNHKWIYMFGDSTTRQVWASYAAPFLGNNFERNAKEWTRQYCNGQSNRVRHRKGGDFPEEGWRGPCGVNEVTCYVSGYGDEGLLTFDWKHFPYEDYDDYLWGERGLFKPGSTERLPDVLTIQFGLHSCWHAHPQGLYSSHLTEANQTMVNQHIENIPKLMKAVRTALSRRPDHNTTVIVVTSGAAYVTNGEPIDSCILRLNRAAVNAAHQESFAVLERGEIERRLMFKSVHTESPYIAPDIHLSQPAQNIIATCLLQMLNCLASSNNGSASYDHLGVDTSEVYAPPPKPLHSPP